MFSINELLRIRRKVDKAMHRVYLLQVERLRCAFNPKEHDKRVLGIDEHGCNVYKGDYSPIYPDSIGPTVAERVLPHAVCTSGSDAHDFVVACRNDAPLKLDGRMLVIQIERPTHYLQGA